MTKLLRFYNSNKRYFLKFIFIGLGTTAIYFGLFSVCWFVFHLNHFLGVSIAYIAAASYQFLMNRKLTFKIENEQSWSEIARYLTLLLLNFMLSLYIMQISLQLFHSALIGLFLTTCVTTTTGYLVFRYWIFDEAISFLADKRQ